MMKKIISMILAALIFATAFCACGKKEEPVEEIKEEIVMEPQISQMKSICELAVMDCYYHDVAKSNIPVKKSFLWWNWTENKHFWIEYSGIVRFGVDVSLLNIEVSGNNVTVTLPEAKVLGCKVDSSSLTEDSFIVDKSSAKITAEDEKAAFEAAQPLLENKASADRALITEATERARRLLEDYIANINSTVGSSYTISWVYADSSGDVGETGETAE